MIPTGARKKFKTDIVPSDRQLWAIGMVVVRWSLLEQYITAFVHSFTDETDPNDPVRKVFDTTRAMMMRLDQWEELTKKHIQPDWQEEMLAIINQVRQLADQRDKIVHGVWSDKENATMVSPEAYGAFSWGKPNHPFSWKMDYGTIMGVALKIDAVQASMFEYAFRASGVGDTGADFRFGTALRRIQNVPNSNL